MKKSITEEIQIPSGIDCHYKDKLMFCKKNGVELKRLISIPNVAVSIKDSKIIFSSKKSTKKEKKSIISMVHHLKNIFLGLENKFHYKLEACNVHFPMTLKIEGKRLVINNFLGEKIPRYANIVDNVDVQIKGTFLTLTSHDRESAGQTAANIEKATKVTSRDRRVFQDGIYIVERPGDKK